VASGRRGGVESVEKRSVLQLLEQRLLVPLDSVHDALSKQEVPEFNDLVIVPEAALFFEPFANIGSGEAVLVNDAFPPPVAHKEVVL